MESKPIIFTDLDGTLLEHQTYSFTAALPALDLVKQREIPLILCSSKTRAEIESWRKRLDNLHPFIAENGGGIFIPHSYFLENELATVWSKKIKIDEYFILILGTPYSQLRGVLEELKRDGFGIKGFGDMDAVEVAEVTRLSLEEARLAKQREFDEPFVFNGGQKELSRLLASIEEKGLQYTQGMFYHLLGDNDKGKAVEILKKLYKKKFGNIFTIALGDSPLDLPMLVEVDYPIIVKNFKGEYNRKVVLPNFIRADGIGPEGWNKAVLKVIQEML
jgi:mannosyl-3-phosphoglycerate phosphatase family protein